MPAAPLTPADFRRSLADSLATLQSLAALEPQVAAAADLVAGCLTAGGQLLVCGNGGSACDAAHFAAEFTGRFTRDRRPYPAIALAEDGGLLTAIGNDYRFEDLFARQVHAFGRPGDVLVAFTTSGRSPNIVAALQAARERGVGSVAFLGRDGGACRGLATVELLVPGDVTARIQEGHKFLLHALCEAVEPRLPA